MTLNSFSYLCFLLAAAALHAALPVRFRSLFLLLASLFFCASNGAVMLAVPALVALVSFFGAKLLSLQQDAKRKKRLLVFLILLLLLPLLLFKYANHWTGLLQSPIQLLLPLGISFYTFEALGYIIDVYHEKLEPERDFLVWLLAIFFFPQFSAGPIARMRDLLPQLRNAERELSPALAAEGFRRILLGAAAKIVLADGMGILINQFYEEPSRYGGGMELFALLLYPLQLYFDFSGYSSIAIGSALLFGVRLSENFTAPYLADSMGGFWRRWHISLSGWLQQYLYIPLGGSRRGLFRTCCNVLIVFLVSGAWHGSVAGYLAWGAVMAAGRIVELLCPALTRRDSRLSRALGRVWVYLLWALSLLFFRLPTQGQLSQFVQQLSAPMQQGPIAALLLAASQDLASIDIAVTWRYYLLFFGSIAVSFAALLFCDIQTDRSLQKKGAPLLTDPLARLPRVLRWAVYWALSLAVCFLYLVVKIGDAPSFIYAGY